jgi:AcrR family transcriptional regulator
MAGQSKETTTSARASSHSATPERAGNATGIGARLFAEKGYSATTTREISRALGVTNGTFYHHFETKEELLVRICDESLDHMIAAAEAALSGHRLAGARTQLEALIRAHLVTMLADHALHMTGLIELRALSPAPRVEVERKRDAYKSILQTQIAGCQAEGIVRTDISSEVLTLLLLNTLNWTVFWFDPDGAMSAAELGDVIASLFLDGASI